jgi:ATP-binding cassette, subfamily C (CFTR/MRP), member 1
VASKSLSVEESEPAGNGFEMVRTGPGAEPEVSDWPTRGRVEFKNVWLRYRPNTPHVLRGVSFTVNGGERIGICGRTGKSD